MSADAAQAATDLPSEPSVMIGAPDRGSPTMGARSQAAVNSDDILESLVTQAAESAFWPMSTSHGEQDALSVVIGAARHSGMCG